MENPNTYSMRIEFDIDTNEEFNTTLQKFPYVLVGFGKDVHAKWNSLKVTIRDQILSFRDRRLVFRTVNMLTAPEIAAKFDVIADPHFILFKNGEELDDYQGWEEQEVQNLYGQARAELKQESS